MDLKLSQFEGPLDLLLHLIRSSKIDIYDIPIFELTEQYIKYLRQAENLNLDIASEFIVMASELLFIKSKMLLPIENMSLESDDIDPRKALVEKLLDYQRYKELSDYLKGREEIGSYAKSKETIKGLIKHVKLSVDKEELKKAVHEMLARIETKKPAPKEAFSEIIEREIISVSDMQDKLFSIISLTKKADLVDAFSKVCNSKPQIAAAFMAMLDMMKDNKIAIEFVNERYVLIEK